MQDDKLFKKLGDFKSRAEAARQYVWADLLMDADNMLDLLIQDIDKFKVEREQEEFDSL